MSKNFMIHTDFENMENHEGKQPVKKTGLAVRPPLLERTTLGTINGPRIQPSRTAKSQVCSMSSLFSKLTSMTSHLLQYLIVLGCVLFL